MRMQRASHRAVMSTHCGKVCRCPVALQPECRVTFWPSHSFKHIWPFSKLCPFFLWYTLRHLVYFSVSMTNAFVKPHRFSLWSLRWSPDSAPVALHCFPYNLSWKGQRYPSHPHFHHSPPSIHTLSRVIWTTWFIRKRRVLGGRPVWVWIPDYLSSHVHLVTSSCLWKPQSPY